jgi:hypothetical protein
MYKVDVVLMNWDRVSHIKKTINKLLNIPNINNIIVSHGKKETIFSSDCFIDSSRVICLDHSELNELYGLSLRFRCKDYITTDAVLIMDDDLIFNDKHIIQLINNYYLHPENITSYYGRRVINYKDEIIYYPLINPNINVNIIYSFFMTLYLFIYIWFNNIKHNIALTKMMIIPIKSLDIFINNSHVIEPFIHNNSKPLWNGEDIFFSLVYSKITGNICKIYKPYIPILETIDSCNGISSQAGHRKYRYDCCKEIVKQLHIKFDSIGNPKFT